MKSNRIALLAKTVVASLILAGLLYLASPTVIAGFKQKSQSNVPVVVQEVAPQPNPVKDYEKMCADRAVWAYTALISTYGIESADAHEIAHMVAYASVIEDVPIEILVSIIKVESEFDSKAKSKHGAIGYAQVKPSAWKNEIPYNVNNKQGNILAGAYVLKRYYLETGNWSDAVKAYNIGITNFNRGKMKKSASIYHEKVYTEMKLIMAQR